MVARADSAGTSQPDRPGSFDSQRKQHGGGRVRPVSIEAPGGINNPARGVHRESANFAGGDLTSAGWRSSRYAVGIRPHSPGFIHPFGVFSFVDQEPPALRVARDLSGRAPGSDQSTFRPPDSFPHLRIARCDSAAARNSPVAAKPMVAARHFPIPLMGTSPFAGPIFVLILSHGERRANRDRVRASQGAGKGYERRSCEFFSSDRARWHGRRLAKNRKDSATFARLIGAGVAPARLARGAPIHRWSPRRRVFPCSRFQSRITIGSNRFFMNHAVVPDDRTGANRECPRRPAVRRSRRAPPGTGLVSYHRLQKLQGRSSYGAHRS